jgi:hypothetical protein
LKLKTCSVPGEIDGTLAGKGDASLLPARARASPTIVLGQGGESLHAEGGLVMARIIFSVIVLSASIAIHSGVSNKTDPEEWLRKAETAYDSVTTYTAVFHKQQIVYCCAAIWLQRPRFSEGSL